LDLIVERIIGREICFRLCLQTLRKISYRIVGLGFLKGEGSKHGQECNKKNCFFHRPASAQQRKLYAEIASGLSENSTTLPRPACTLHGEYA
jgi:hypothetical protein